MVMLLFTTLVVTGLPQRYFQAGWAQSIILGLGGIDQVRFIHRVSGWLFAFLALYHFLEVDFLLLVKKSRPSLFFSLKDARDAVGVLRYSLGLSQEHPPFDRFDYRQKFEYWGLVFGGVTMIFTGFILMYPTWVTKVLPGEFIPAAREAHRNEALLAFVLIVVWHLYGAHFGPGKFPADPTIFTGKISRERMEKEHPLELDRLEEAGTKGGGDTTGEEGPAPKPGQPAL